MLKFSKEEKCVCVCLWGVGGCDRHLVYRESVLQTQNFHAEEGYSSFIET